MTLSDETRSAIERLVARFPEPRSALLPALKLAQGEVGYLPRETIAETADWWVYRTPQRSSWRPSTRCCTSSRARRRGWSCARSCRARCEGPRPSFADSRRRPTIDRQRVEIEAPANASERVIGRRWPESARIIARAWMARPSKT